MAPPVQAVQLLIVPVIAADKSEGCVMVKTVGWAQELASLTVAVWAPPIKLLIIPVIFEVAVLAGLVLNVYEYGPTPPLATMVADPLDPPAQETAVVLKDIAIGDG